LALGDINRATGGLQVKKTHLRVADLKETRKVVFKAGERPAHKVKKELQPEGCPFSSEF